MPSNNINRKKHNIKFYDYRKWAWDQDIKPTGRKFVLICLSEFSDDKGSCYPAVETIAAMVGQGDSTVRGHLNALEKSGLILRERLRYKDGTLAQYRYFLQCQISAVGELTTARNAPSPPPEMPLHHRQKLTDNNNHITTIEQSIGKTPKEFELESEKRTSNADEVFEKLWKHILGFIPKEKKSYFSKKISRERFYKIVKRKRNPISATRIANAVLWFYADDGQTKDDRKYMKALQYVLKDELFEIYLEKGAFTAKSASGATMDDVWAQRGKIYLRHGWDHSWLSGHSRETPQQYWKYFPESDWEKLGWKK